MSRTKVLHNSIQGEDINPLNMLVLSNNTLHQRPVDQALPSLWSNITPDFFHKKSFRYKCRQGIPPALRCSVYITAIVSKAHPTQLDKMEYGTLRKVKKVNSIWDTIVSSLFTDIYHTRNMLLPELGSNITIDTLAVDHGMNQDYPVNDHGLRAIHKLLNIGKHHLGIEFCPLASDLIALLLTIMSESYAYTTLRNMYMIAPHFFPICGTHHFSWCKTFMDIMATCYPKTEKILKTIHVLTPDGLDPIFRRFFVPILPRDLVMRILDVYIMEGYKVLYRIGSALLCLCAECILGKKIETREEWWDYVKNFTFSEDFRTTGFQRVWTQSFEQKFHYFQNNISRKKKIMQLVRRNLSNISPFPRRNNLRKTMEKNESWADIYIMHHVAHESSTNSDNILPVGLVEKGIPIVLAKPSSFRRSLAIFLPSQFKSTKLDLIYSSEVHGRSLANFYRKCAVAKHTVVMLEVRDTNLIIGMFATDTWRNYPTAYGNGECFLFRLNPDPFCYYWNPDTPSISSDLSQYELDSDEALLRQFMRSNRSFISMGGSRDGGYGLRLDEDLTVGSSARAIGFDNDPLVGDYSEFQIGILEVFRLLNDINGYPVDRYNDI